MAIKILQIPVSAIMSAYEKMTADSDGTFKKRIEWAAKEDEAVLVDMDRFLTEGFKIVDVQEVRANDLQKHDVWGETSIDHADIVVLLAVDKSKIYPYVLPRKILGGRKKVKISSHPEKYKGQWAAFRQVWDELSLCAMRLNETAASFYGFDEVRYAVV